MKVVYFIAGIVVCIGAVSEGIRRNWLGAFGLTLVAIILFTAVFERPTGGRAWGGAEMKRLRKPKAKPGELLAKWGKTSDDGPAIFYAWGQGCHRGDGGMLAWRFEQMIYHNLTLFDELKARGYDLTTLKFSVSKVAGRAASQEGTE